MKNIFDGMKVHGVKVPAPNERVLKIMLSPELGNTDKCTMVLTLISPKNGTSPHTHSSDEMIYVASGRGVARVGQEKMEIGEGVIIRAPKGVEHFVENTGEETVKLVCFFVPPIKPSGHFEEAVSKAKESFENA